MVALVLAAVLSAASLHPSPTLCPEAACRLRLEGFEDGQPSARRGNADITVAIMVSAAILVAAWDIFARPTESRIITDASKRWTILPLAVGVLAGHWFWNAPTRDRPALLISVAGAFLVWDLSFLLRGPATGLEAEVRYPAVPLFAGIALGRLLWSQR